jgi:hypothetical protein
MPRTRIEYGGCSVTNRPSVRSARSTVPRRSRGRGRSRNRTRGSCPGAAGRSAPRGSPRPRCPDLAGAPGRGRSSPGWHDLTQRHHRGRMNPWPFARKSRVNHVPGYAQERLSRTGLPDGVRWMGHGLRMFATWIRSLASPTSLDSQRSGARSRADSYGQGDRSGDRAGIGTVMITSRAVPGPLSPHHLRVVRRHAATHGFAGVRTGYPSNP